MNTLFIVLNIAGLLLLVGLLYGMHRKKVSFSKRVFTGLGLGIAYGLILNFAYGTDSTVLEETMPWFNLIGTGYVKLLQMIVMPLVFISILAAFTKVTIGKNFGKMAALILGILIGTTAIAAIIGISATLLFGLDASEIVQGEAEVARGVSIEERSTGVADRTLPDQLIDLLPANPFLDFTGARPTSTIGVVIFAAFLGFAYLTLSRRDEKNAATVKKGIDAIYSLIMGVVKIVLRLTPYGILAIIARTVATSDFGAIYNLGKFVLASYAAILVMFGIHLLIIALSGLNPITYVKKAGEALLFAFSSRSSAGTAPDFYASSLKLWKKLFVQKIKLNLFPEKICFICCRAVYKFVKFFCSDNKFLRIIFKSRFVFRNFIFYISYNISFVYRADFYSAVIIDSGNDDIRNYFLRHAFLSRSSFTLHPIL